MEIVKEGFKYASYDATADDQLVIVDRGCFGVRSSLAVDLLRDLTVLIDKTVAGSPGTVR